MNPRQRPADWIAASGGTFAVCVGALCVLLTLASCGSAPPSDPVAVGKAVFLSKGCAACHVSGSANLAPKLEGIYGKNRLLADGNEAVINDAYLRESVLDPAARVAKGYAPAMPSYKGLLTEDELESLVAYIKSLK